MTTASGQSNSVTFTTTIIGGSNSSVMIPMKSSVHRPTQVAPIRCFLNDIPNIIAQHQHQHQQQQQQQQCVFMDESQDLESSLTTIKTGHNNDSQHSRSTLLDHNSNDILNDSHYHTRKRRKIERTPPSTLWLRLLGTVVNISSNISMIDGVEDVPQMTDENMNMNPIITTNAVPPVLPQPPPPSHHVYNHIITLDDGTGTIIAIHVTLAMIQKIPIQPGMILDVIVRVEPDRTSSSSSSSNVTFDHPCSHPVTNKNHMNVRFIADQLVVQDSTKETLRWLELSYQASMKNRLLSSSSTKAAIDDRNSNNHLNKEKAYDDDDDNMCEDDNHNTKNSTSPPPAPPLSLSPSSSSVSLPYASSPKPMRYHTPQSSQWMGYPSRDLSSEDIYRIIASECEFAASAKMDHAMTNSTTSDTGGGGGGVSLQDLADCFDYSTSYISTLVQELQNSGQIYQNEHGLYTLL